MEGLGVQRQKGCADVGGRAALDVYVGAAQVSLPPGLGVQGAATFQAELHCGDGGVAPGLYRGVAAGRDGCLFCGLQPHVAPGLLVMVPLDSRAGMRRLLEARQTQAFDTEADSERVHVVPVPISGSDITITAMKTG